MNRLEEEFGDYLFALVNYARFYWSQSRRLRLSDATRNFIRRFQFIEDKGKETGKAIHEMTLDQMEVFWNQAKEEEKQ